MQQTILRTTKKYHGENCNFRKLVNISRDQAIFNEILLTCV